MIEGLPRTSAAIEQGMAQGLHLGAQVHVSLRGRSVGGGAVGEARAGVAMTDDTLVIWFSMTKVVVAVAVAQQWERGHLDLDDPVARHVPEFGANGKDRITVRHCLTHTGGFRGADGVQSPAKDPDQWWSEMVAGVCAVRPEPSWPPGEKAGYHLLAGTTMLAEVVRRLDGRPFARYVREEVFLPLGMHDCWVGMPLEKAAEYGERVGTMHLTTGESPLPLPRLDSKGWLTHCIPGAGGRGPMRQLGRLYEALVAGGERDGVRILGTQTVEALAARHRVGMHDKTFGIACDWGLGVAVDSSAMGRHCSRRAFGHGGAQSSLAFADPEHGLAVAVLTNGMPGPERHYTRFSAISDAVYEDLGLADPASPGREKAVPREHTMVGG